MQLETKTGVYILVGLLALSGAVIFQEVHNIKDITENDDLIVPGKNFQPLNGSLGSFSYNAFYFNATDKPGNSSHHGVFLLRLNESISKEYNTVSSSSYIRASVLNAHVHETELNKSYYCENLGLNVIQNGEILETVNIVEDERYQDVEVKARQTSQPSTITLELSRNPNCTSFQHFATVDKFHLKEQRLRPWTYILESYLS